MSYRREVGPGRLYDVIGAQQFCLMVRLGLREHHKLIDLGCGSLRGGRLFIPYLLPGNYHGIEPNAKLIREGIQYELGWSIRDVKRPTFYHFDNFAISQTGIQADFILAQSILSHAGNDILEKIIREASLTLVKDGKFAATFFEGAWQAKTGWLGHEVITYPYSHIIKIAKANRLSVQKLDTTHPVGQKWILFRHL
jgi:hypothetical protein